MKSSERGLEVNEELREELEIHEDFRKGTRG